MFVFSRLALVISFSCYFINGLNAMEAVQEYVSEGQISIINNGPAGFCGEKDRSYFLQLGIESTEKDIFVPVSVDLHDEASFPVSYIPARLVAFSDNGSKIKLTIDNRQFMLTCENTDCCTTTERSFHSNFCRKLSEIAKNTENRFILSGLRFKNYQSYEACMSDVWCLIENKIVISKENNDYTLSDKGLSLTNVNQFQTECIVEKNNNSLLLLSLVRSLSTEDNSQ